MSIDGQQFGLAAADYATFRAGFPDSFFERMASFDVGLPGQRVLDLGCGTGTLARGFAARGCRVIGIDPDADMLYQARRLAWEQNLDIEFCQAGAEHTGVDDHSVDVVTAGQCWHWFDRPRAAAEAQRVLVNGGALIIAHFDWLPLPGNMVAATEALIEQFNPQWTMGGGRGIYPWWMPDLSVAGFSRLETFSYDLDVPYSSEAWRGRIRASAGVVAMDEATRATFDQALGELLTTHFGEHHEVPHRVFAVVARRL